jgi:thymidylate kinase
MIVVCDRFPQNQVYGFMDGPLLSPWLNHRSWWRRALARWERVPYDSAQTHPPDLIIRLDVSPEVAAGRKADMGFDEIRRRAAVAQAVRYPTQAQLAMLDATGSFDDVLLAAKNLIWDAI